MFACQVSEGDGGERREVRKEWQQEVEVEEEEEQ